MWNQFIFFAGITSGANNIITLYIIIHINQYISKGDYTFGKYLFWFVTTFTVLVFEVDASRKLYTGTSSASELKKNYLISIMLGKYLGPETRGVVQWCLKLRKYIVVLTTKSTLFLKNCYTCIYKSIHLWKCCLYKIYTNNDHFACDRRPQLHVSTWRSEFASG